MSHRLLGRRFLLRRQLYLHLHIMLVNCNRNRISRMSSMAEGKRVAVIGSGISGLSAAWLLNK